MCQSGWYEWIQKADDGESRAVQTVAPSPMQIADNMEAIALKPETEATLRLTVNTNRSWPYAYGTKWMGGGKPRKYECEVVADWCMKTWKAGCPIRF
ncbi:hypothetical protein [Alteribacillus bidgolensis]|uniref:Uncharacterized protein n=1 Tax=Alteribacillus bidgolensis TaxID=930129 RepID=A0A1G8JF42_9BACI|nr:hypothetical protein [Alteribacillus bidgolensis]SDI29762.1 hypothetical protein SAMN05216352_106172 [Alteribacillus bidgolensis]